MSLCDRCSQSLAAKKRHVVFGEVKPAVNQQQADIQPTDYSVTDRSPTAQTTRLM